MNIGTYIYRQAEVLDFSDPYEVFSTAARLSSSKTQFSPMLISQTGEPVSARGGYKVIPDYHFHNHPPLDVLIISGEVHVAEMDNPETLDWIKAQSNEASLTTSVCTGAFILAAAGVLTHQKVTTHWEDIPDLRQRFPGLTVIEAVRWVHEDSIITSAGISAGTDMSLHMVSRLHSMELAEKTARQMDFDWQRR